MVICLRAGWPLDFTKGGGAETTVTRTHWTKLAPTLLRSGLVLSKNGLNRARVIRLHERPDDRQWSWVFQEANRLRRVIVILFLGRKGTPMPRYTCKADIKAALRGIARAIHSFTSNVLEEPFPEKLAALSKRLTEAATSQTVGRPPIEGHRTPRGAED